MTDIQVWALEIMESCSRQVATWPSYGERVPNQTHMSRYATKIETTTTGRDKYDTVDAP